MAEGTDSTLSPPGGRPPEVDPERLPPGHALGGGRYRILRFLASGAMGEVYEAEDRELSTSVALKRIRPAIATRPSAAARFKREIQLARRVTHASVCRIFDLGAGPGELFYTMELLGGETLAARLARAGALSVDQARPIALQLLAGLGAAHAAGILHRDLKPHNVILDGGRAVITDFGLARVDEPSGDDKLTETGALVGTPAYMAPEQIEGAELTTATDLYAFGVMLFEMVTGKLPFHGPSPMATATRRLREDAPAPRSLVPGLDERWDAAIRRCLERAPARRFASAGEVAAALAPPARRRPGWIVLVAAGVLAVAGGLLLLWPRGEPARVESAAAAAPAPRRAIATLGFRNLSGRADRAWLATAVSEMLRTEVSAGGLRSLAGEDVARAKLELGLADSDGYARDTLARLRENLRADLVIVGSYTAVGDRLRLDTRVQDTATGEILVEASETGKESELIELVGRTGAKLRARLDPGATGAGAAASLPADPEAARLYSEGLATLRALDPTGAVPLLERAAGLTPDFAPVHAALAAAYGDLGRERDTESAARRAFERSAGLPREERLVIEGRFREASRDWPRAIAVYRSLRELYPDDLEHGLLLARAQIKQGQLADAAATVTALRALRGAADDPRLDLIAPERNYRVSLELALSAARKAKARGARFVEAEALANAAWSSLYLGDLPRARAMLDEARAIQRALGSRLGEFYVLNALAPVQSLAGDGRAAAATFAEAVAMATSIGSRSLNVIALGNLVFIHLDNGDLALARAALAELQPLAHEADEIARVVYALRLESWLRRDEGDLPAARARLEEAERLARTRGVEDDDQPWSQILRTEIDLRAGDAELALAGLRRVEKELVERDDILSLTETRALMVEALLQLGRTDEALREAQAVAAAGERFAAFAPLSAALLAQARLAAGQRSEAAAALDAARPHARVGTLAKQAAYALAELAVRTGSAEARARVEAIRADAERRGLPYLALEARLALAEDARAAGKRAPDLAAIERDARRRGFLALAARAASR